MPRIRKEQRTREAQEGKAAAKNGKKPNNKLLMILYVLLVVSVVVYALHNNIIVGVIVFALIIVIIYFELKYSVKAEGVKKSAIDVGIAIGAAILIWLLASVILETSAPLDAVASCSMLPTLGRGDVVVLHGISPISSFVNSTHVPIVNVSTAAFDAMEANMSSEFLAYYAYFNGNKSDIASIYASGSPSIGLYNYECILDAQYEGKTDYSGCYVQSQGDNLIKYNYTVGKVLVNGVQENIVETSSIEIANTTIFENYSNPIIVYQTTSRDSFSGDIIHRLVALIRTNNTYYSVTRGDNNPGIDIEYGNYPAPQSQILGDVIAHAPLLGYIKLIVSGQLGAVPGCNQTILH